MAIKIYGGNRNHISRLEKWLEQQHKKGNAFQSGKFGFAKFQKTEPVEIKYTLMPFACGHDAKSNIDGLEYVGVMRGLLTGYHVYRGENHQEVKRTKRVIKYKTIGYGICLLLLVWLFAAAVVYITTPLNEFTTLSDLLFRFANIQTRSTTPLFLWMLRWQWFTALWIATALVMGITHCIASIYYSMRRRNCRSFHRIWRCVAILIGCLGIVVLIGHGSANEGMELKKDCAELCAALEIPENTWNCFEEQGTSLGARRYRMAACSYTAKPSVWVHELGFWTQGQLVDALDSYLKEIDGTPVLTLTSGEETWIIMKAFLWTGGQEGYAAYCLHGNTLRYVHYIGEKTVEEFASAIEDWRG